jgi:hypothetical protein
MQADDGMSMEHRREAGRLIDQASDGMGCQAGAAAAVRAMGRDRATTAVGATRLGCCGCSRCDGEGRSYYSGGCDGARQCVRQVGAELLQR